MRQQSSGASSCSGCAKPLAHDGTVCISESEVRVLKRLLKAAINRLGFEIWRVPEGPPANPAPVDRTVEIQAMLAFRQISDSPLRRVQYGSGANLFPPPWLNIDLPPELVPYAAERASLYLPMNLTCRHPFPTDFFDFGFSEDFLEHLSQADSLVFLSEVFRTLKPGGVVRLSFPGFRQVLTKHFRSPDFAGADVGRTEAYTMWGHEHFYSEESLTSAARHIGFSEVTFCDYGQSKHPEFTGLDAREHQRDLNIYAELRK
jgi:predicted SAM-dependent methyltransferase